MEINETQNKISEIDKRLPEIKIKLQQIDIDAESIKLLLIEEEALILENKTLTLFLEKKQQLLTNHENSYNIDQAPITKSNYNTIAQYCIDKLFDIPEFTTLITIAVIGKNRASKYGDIEKISFNSDEAIEEVINKQLLKILPINDRWYDTPIRNW